MQGFEDVTLSWRGEDYIVPADQQLMLIAKIEDALAGESGEQALSVLMRSQGPPHARMAMAFGAALRHAGANVSDNDVYLSMQSDLSKGKADRIAAIQMATVALISIVSPPMGSALRAGIQKKSPTKKRKTKAS